jgi:hypothetical protein
MTRVSEKVPLFTTLCFLLVLSFNLPDLESILATVAAIDCVLAAPASVATLATEDSPAVQVLETPATQEQEVSARQSPCNASTRLDLAFMVRELSWHEHSSVTAASTTGGGDIDAADLDAPAPRHTVKLPYTGTPLPIREQHRRKLHLRRTSPRLRSAGGDHRAVVITAIEQRGSLRSRWHTILRSVLPCFRI